MLYLCRVVFRFLNNYLAHKAAWELVGDLRQRIYVKLQDMDRSFFQDKQTGDLMSRVVNDTREFELLYAHIIPELISNFITFAGVLIILLTNFLRFRPLDSRKKKVLLLNMLNSLMKKEFLY